MKAISGLSVRRLVQPLAIATLVLTAAATSSGAAPCDRDCTVTFRLADNVTLGSLEWDADYGLLEGEVQDVGPQVDCIGLLGGALTAFNDDDGGAVLSSALISLSGFTGPIDLSECIVNACGQDPTAEDFVVGNVVAYDPEVNEIQPVPDVIVSSIECEGPTSTTSTTVTTMDTTTTTSTLPPVACEKDYQVVYRLDSATDLVGQLQFDSSYAGAPDFGFEGAGGTVACVGNAPGALFAANDNEVSQKLTLGFVSISGFTAPNNLATCVYNGVAGDPPVAGDFPLSNLISTDTDFNDIVASVSVSVTAIASEGCGCGDGVVDGALEECDDGNEVDTDACPSNCRFAACGDGYLQAGVEQCDDGNVVDTDACTSACEAATCGDGVVRAGVEQCDDGNDVDTDACTTACQHAYCGDGIVRAGVEACDDANANQSDACLSTCVLATCGDGFVRSGIEQCDDGNLSDTDACLGTCVAATCGDGFVRSGTEECDDANLIATDACTATCRNARCGDGIVRSGVEDCDDGNDSQTDACLATCVVATCGDGLVREGIEECDDANLVEGDGCTPGTCQLQQICGDADGNGVVTAPDALAVMRSAVGLEVICPTWICNIDENGTVNVTDALRVLRRAVNLPVTLVCGDPVELRIILDQAISVGAVQLEIDYSNARFSIDGDGEGAACESLVPDSIDNFNDLSGEEKLLAAWISLGGFSGPRTLARCDIAATGSTRESSVVVKVVAAASPTSEELPAGVKFRAIPY